MMSRPFTTRRSPESEPLVQAKMNQPLMGKIMFLTIVGALVCAWCLFESWNRNVISDLFGLGEVTNQQQVLWKWEVTHPFNFPLALAFFQFAFMGIVFSICWWLTSKRHDSELAKVRENLFSIRWGSLVATHVFSTFWLQSLIMPVAMMTPAVFAASRALEIPAAAALRSQIIGGRYGGHPLSTTTLMFGAGMLMIFSQTQIAECLCMWSGHGVALGGVALFLVYGMVLILPAANAVCLESVMVKFDTNPTLMLATMNVLACVCFAPILAFAHFSGLESFTSAVIVTTSSPTIYMLVVWLGVQVTVLSALGLALIATVDSFWAVALQSLKPVFWWCSQLAYLFMLGHQVLSVNRPNASFWGYIMMLGCFLVTAAAVIDSTTPRLQGASSNREAEKV